MQPVVQDPQRFGAGLVERERVEPVPGSELEGGVYGKRDNRAPKKKSNSRPEGLTPKGYILQTDFEHPRHFELVNNFSFPTPKGK